MQDVFVAGSVVDLFQNGRRRRSCYEPFEGGLRLVVCLTEVESLVRQDNVVRHAKASE